jgi:uncharacterized protein YigE (DUF2233 family)
MRKKTFIILLFSLATFALIAWGSAKIQKNHDEVTVATLAEINIPDNIEYQELHLIDEKADAASSKDLMLLQIDPTEYKFSIYQNTAHKDAKNLQEISKKTNATIAVNGGFFTEDFKPTGLLISQNQILHPLSQAELLNGIFAIGNDNTPRLLTQSDPIEPTEYAFAIQCGPVLINQNGEITISKDTGKIASRTAIGIDKDNNIVIILLKQSLLNTDNTISLYEFAHLMKEHSQLKHLQLHSVLNLDGGPSTGIVIGENYYPEMERVQNVIIIK